jgi:type II secretory pathway pseudopilin PulG
LKTQQGASLVEVVVALAVFGLVTALIGTIFALSHRYTRVYHQLSSAERECVRCTEALSSLLHPCRAESLGPGTAVNVCWALSSRTPSTTVGNTSFDPDSGQLLYKKWHGAWCQPDGQLKSSELPLVSGEATFEAVMLGATPSSVNDFLVAPRHHVLAKNIRRFSVSLLGSGLLHLEVESQTTESGNPATRYQISSSVTAQ